MNWWIFAGVIALLALGWLGASFFALKGYNVLSYFIKGEKYAASEITALKDRVIALEKRLR